MGYHYPMKQQIANRLGVAHIRDTVRQLVEGKITRFQAMESLRIIRQVCGGAIGKHIHLI